jgi:hypothetical protein
VTHLLGLLVGAVPVPSPTTEELDPLSVSPGLVGFLATFAVAVATVLLVLDLVRRLRRMRFREDQERRREEEAARAREAEHEGAAEDTATEDDPPPPLVT